MLASSGLFGVVSGTVTRRWHELAVRLALGATHAMAACYAPARRVPRIDPAPLLRQE